MSKKRGKKQVNYNNRRKRRKKQFHFDTAVRVLFVLAFIFYLGTKIGLHSYNITLSIQDQKMTKVMDAQQEKVDKLTSDVNILQEKSRVLGLLDDKVADNQKNVYIID